MKNLLVLALVATCTAAAAQPAPMPVTKMLDALKTAPTEEQAQALEMQIVLAWRATITPAVQLLADHAIQALHKQDLHTATSDLDAALDLQPAAAELWRLHGDIRFANGDTRGAIEDSAQALSREPRDFQALADLSRFSEAAGDDKRALAAWQKLLEMDPKAPHGAARLRALELKVSGQPL